MHLDKYIPSRYRCGCGGNLKFHYSCINDGMKYDQKRYTDLVVNDSVKIYNSDRTYNRKIFNNKSVRKIVAAQNFDYEFHHYFDYSFPILTFICNKCNKFRDFMIKDVEIYPIVGGSFNSCLRKLPPYIARKGQ